MNFSSCGNHTIDYILNIEAAKAHGEKLRLETKVAVDPLLPFEDGELCSLLTNLIDNAIEACRGKEEAVIEVGLRQYKESFLIRVVNPCDREVDSQNEEGDFITSKPDKEYHGYGIKIIRKIAEKYNGAASFNITDGKFVADVMLSMAGGEDRARKGEEKNGK